MEKIVRVIFSILVAEANKYVSCLLKGSLLLL
jgi:hypothetical protein